MCLTTHEILLGLKHLQNEALRTGAKFKTTTLQTESKTA